MRVLKAVTSILGVLPFLWFLSFLTILFTATIRLGYIPNYGNPIDPNSLGLNTISFIHFVLWFLAFVSFFIWTLGTLLRAIFSRGKFRPNRICTVLFLIGVIGFFVFKMAFTWTFLWVFD